MVGEKDMPTPLIITQGEQRKYAGKLTGFEGSKLESKFTYGKLNAWDSSQTLTSLKLNLLICTVGIIR